MTHRITLTSDFVYDGGATLTEEGIKLDDGRVITDAGDFNVIIKGQIRDEMSPPRLQAVEDTSPDKEYDAK